MQFTQEVGVFAYTNSIENDVGIAMERQTVQGLSLTPVNLTGSMFTKIGSAVVEVTLLDKEAIIPAIVESLRKEQTKLRAKAEMQSKQIEDRIQSMLAICYDAGTA